MAFICGTNRWAPRKGKLQNISNWVSLVNFRHASLLHLRPYGRPSSMGTQYIEWPHSNFQTTISPLLIWLFIVCVICAFIQTRKGFIDTNRFAETDEFPLGYFALISGLVSTLAVFVIWAMRCIAELQIVSADEVFWIANLAVGMVFGIILFVLLLLIFFLYYISAKHSRARIESKLNKEQ